MARITLWMVGSVSQAVDPEGDKAHQVRLQSTFTRLWGQKIKKFGIFALLLRPNLVFYGIIN